MAGEIVSGIPLDQAGAVVARWAHIGAATLAVGVPVFIRFILMPAAKETLDEPTHLRLREAINRRWRHVVHGVITLLLLSGLYTFLVVARWKNLPPERQHLYHMLFGIKMLAAIFVFFLASVLPGRASAFAALRKNSRLWLVVLISLAAVIVMCSGVLRYL